VISPGGVLAVIPAVQLIKMGPERAEQLAHVRADESTVHVPIGGQRVKVGAELARRRVTLRLDGHLMHVIRLSTGLGIRY